MDQGKTWQAGGKLGHLLDLTDFAKGHRQYFLRFHSGARALTDANLTIKTVCQANVAILPRLKESGATISFSNGRQAVVSAGPNKPQAAAHIIAGAFDTPAVTLGLAAPRHEPVIAIYAAAHMASGNPPSPETKYQIEFSSNQGRTWWPLVKDWKIPRVGDEPADFWSQSFCYGSTNLATETVSSIQVRFRNDGGKKILRAEAHLVYRTAGKDATKVTFAWNDLTGQQTASHIFVPKDAPKWELATGKSVETRWIEFAIPE
jgi:hypothetical protein